MAARWTVMLYMAADRAGLECPSLRKFLDLAAAGSGSSVNFLVRLSRPPQHQDGCPGSEAERWSGIRTYRLRAGTTLASPDEFRASDGDIRSARNLEEFVSWSLEQCPSQYTMLIFVGDHVDFSGPVADPLADGIGNGGIVVDRVELGAGGVDVAGQRIDAGDLRTGLGIVGLHGQHALERGDRFAEMAAVGGGQAEHIVERRITGAGIGLG